MIILAGAVVITLNNSGIINKANEAVEKSDEAQVKQIAQLGWAEAYVEYGANQEKLEEGVKNALTKNDLKLEDYGMNVTTSGVEIAKGWLQSGLTVVKGTQKLEIGDTVEYVATGTDYEGYWKVLGAENGELLIVSADDVETDYKLSNEHVSASSVALAGYDYINGVSKLNTLCEAYGNGEGATGARSIKAEDVNRVTGYNPQTAGYGKGEVNEYGNEIIYSWTGNDDPYYSATNGVKGDMDPDEHVGSFIYFNGKKFVTSENTGATAEKPIEITKLKSTMYSYYPTTLTTSSSGEVKGIAEDTKAYIMLFRNSENTSNAHYWLASQCVETETYCVYFGMHAVKNGSVRSVYFVYSNDDCGGSMEGVRAVVSLGTDIQFSGSSADGWSF